MVPDMRLLIIGRGYVNYCKGSTVGAVQLVLHLISWYCTKLELGWGGGVAVDWLYSVSFYISEDLFTSQLRGFLGQSVEFVIGCFTRCCSLY